jgi:hypothetical protein
MVATSETYRKADYRRCPGNFSIARLFIERRRSLPASKFERLLCLYD